jgi:DNA-binding NtrC family response regulator
LVHRLGPHRGGRFREVPCSPAVEPGEVAGWFADERGGGDSNQGDRGSIVLDEVADLTKEAQASLLGGLIPHEVPGGARRCPPWR